MDEKQMLPTVFDYQSSQVRAFMRGETPWFVAKDVCMVLGISNSRDAIARLKAEERDDVGISDAIGRTQQTTIISEYALYKLAFRSNKPQAEAFTDWVASEVLPSIRKTGAYTIQPGIPAHGNELMTQRLELFYSRTTLKAGYWCIFVEMAAYSYYYPALAENALPDGSVGHYWMEHIREHPETFDIRLIKTYRHWYPDQRRWQPANQYPNEWLGDFRTWFVEIYLVKYYPKYRQKHTLVLPSGEMRALPESQEKEHSL